MHVEPASLGLYYHIPFCSRLCHYCDFVKTALFSGEQQQAYLAALVKSTELWLEQRAELAGTDAFAFSSVFFGGGTPSLLAAEYAPLFAAFRPHLQTEAEITLEANPEHISAERLALWRELGINRLSLGVQSFQSAGLKFLTREHSPEQAVAAVRLARQYIQNVNIDLIYGWPGQSPALWREDLEQALGLGVQHLSLYSLTYEGQTPFARRVQRGVLEPAADEALLALYELACARLKTAGMVHEEVSNWALPGYESRHNALYWHGSSYLGIGAGAHSYLRDLGPWGLRWKVNSSWRGFSHVYAKEAGAGATSIRELLGRGGHELEEGRDAEALILEEVSSGLRTLKGVNLDALCKKTGYKWRPRPSLVQAFEQNWLSLDAGGQLRLTESEWFRETRWSLEVAMSLEKGVQ